MPTTATGTDWMPRTWGGKRAMFTNVRAKLVNHKDELGLTDDQLTTVQDLCSEAVAIIDYQTQQHSASQGVTEWRDNAFTGSPKGSDLTAPPGQPTFSMPSDGVIGILALFRDYREQWVAASGWTQAIGEDLMVVKVEGETLDASQVTPLITVAPAQFGYVAGITVTDRGDADQWIVETRQQGDDWQTAGAFTGKTADVTITPKNPGQPEVVEFRIRLRKSNQNYGNLSQTATVTVNP